MDADKDTKSSMSLYFMEDNPVEAILIKGSGSDYVLMNRIFKKMFSIPEVNTIQEVLKLIPDREEDIIMLSDRINSRDNTLWDKPVKIQNNGKLYNFYIFYNPDFELVIVHARDMSELEKLTSQLDDYAKGLVQNIFELEISQRNLIKSGNRLNRQLKASTDLGLTTYESYKSTKPVFKIFTEIAASTIDVERCGIWLLDDNGEKLRCDDLFLASTNLHISDIRLSNKTSPEIFKTIKTERLLRADDALNNSLTRDLSKSYLIPNGITSVLVATIVSKGKVAGLVSFEQVGNMRKWEDDESGFAVIFSDHVARILSDVEKNMLESQLIQSQKMETIGTLVGGLAHDFNNLLGGIVGSLSLLRYNSKDIEEEKLLKYLNIMETASGRATDLVKQLLAVASKQDLVMAPVDLNLAISHIVKISKNTFDKSVEIKYNFHPSTAVTNADPTQIEQVLLNLCINAYHAMTVMRDENDHRGGIISLDIKKFHPDDHFMQIHPNAHNNDYWNISIEDTGIGMTKKTMDRIFEPFFTTKKDTRVKGSGLGLTMVYNIIQDHNGFIDVHSEPDAGSTFNVYLPVLEQEYTKVIKEITEKIITGEGVILVIDDEELIRVTTKRMLQTSGYEVIVAENGEEGVECYRKNHDRISAVILDMSMPKKCGRDAYYEMKKIDPDVKVLLATGYRHDERAEEIIKSGVKGFIQKPYTVYELSEAIHNVMNI